jgi:small redox-active disulfide protein 2
MLLHKKTQTKNVQKIKSPRRKEFMLTIKILGAGCQNCQTLAALTKHAVEYLEIDATIEKVTDREEIGKYKILATPGLVINEKVVSAGRIPSEAEITTMLTSALATQ